MNWDERWIGMASYVAEWSKDRSRKMGAVIVDDRNVVVAFGWNGFPRGVDDNVESRHQRPEKYNWTEHAERNALYNAAACGSSTLNCRIYQTMYPCSPCARGLVQAGIKEIVTFEPDWNDETYKDDFRTSKEMLEECGVVVRFMKGASPKRAPNVSHCNHDHSIIDEDHDVFDWASYPDKKTVFKKILGLFKK